MLGNGGGLVVNGVKVRPWGDDVGSSLHAGWAIRASETAREEGRGGSALEVK